jgi:enoyl-CoA hydratase
MTEPAVSIGPTVLVEKSDRGVTRLTLNRPDRLNALDEATFELLHRVIDEVDSDDECRVLVVTGAGRGFCAGFDLVSGGYDGDASASGRTMPQLLRGQARIGDIVARIRRLRPAVVARVNGAAAGAGLALALAADIRVASTTAAFIVAPVKIGLSGGEMGISYLLPRLIGLSRATELSLTGRKLDAAEARECGLVSRVVAAEKLDGAVAGVVGQLLANAPFSIWMTRELLAANVDAPSLDHALALENRTQVLAGYGPDMAEAVQAFRERRPPVYGS